MCREVWAGPENSGFDVGDMLILALVGIDLLVTVLEPAGNLSLFSISKDL